MFYVPDFEPRNLMTFYGKFCYIADAAMFFMACLSFHFIRLVLPYWIYAGDMTPMTLLMGSGGDGRKISTGYRSYKLLELITGLSDPEEALGLDSWHYIALLK